MNTRKYIIKAIVLVFSSILMMACTDLDEELYDRVTSENFIQTRDDVYRTFLRTFEHGYWTVQGDQYILQELSADQMMTPNRQGDWFDGGTYIRAHKHEWTPEDAYVNNAWGNLYTGIVQATNSMEDIAALDPTKFGMNEAEQMQLLAELKTMRAWYYLRLFDFYRNIEIITAVKGETKGKPQSTPQETFSFIETELKDALPDLLSKGDPGTAAFDGRWTKAGAMALLARLYLNAQVYIGEDKYAECAQICQDLINGVYGEYGIEERWDAPFDYNNDDSKETIFAFPGTFGRSHWQYTEGMYWWMAPYNVDKYFGFSEFGGSNPRFSMQPGKDVDNVEYSFNLGKPFVKFQKYPDDIRIKKYKNIGHSTREGMFLMGYLTYNDNQDTVKSSRGYNLYIRDQVGHFEDLKPGQELADKESNMNHADQNSGIYPVKYPFYPDESPNKIESDYVEIRMAEAYYMLAECKFRNGNLSEASTLLNEVRGRYYPQGSESLYALDGSELTEQELLDEWGREFLAEGRRRTDLIRFGKFTTGNWWDKEPDNSTHLRIFPLGRNVLNVNPQLVQNPGYN
ncbi:RagB/SusD family nutrient uptake outer membrane protein [Echinicola marina]|uniref:RagB/SusD family nutrient uptake outer membrane protein n=1 Tax=Echinicola marina TaxID=2859768 RepID=UPI001CF71062|nr:RagB/SusD family nutrient uptake outer membrane protein [Echinicola marina]UCS94906.1 RagB/SusD family nutrient uptake outer membrane protein [Echinicola marina]